MTVTCHVSRANVTTSWSRQLLPHLTFIVDLLKCTTENGASFLALNESDA